MTPEEALALHREALVIDSHNDSTVAHIRRGNLGLGGERGPERASRAGAVAYLRQYLSPLGEGSQIARRAAALVRELAGEEVLEPLREEAKTSGRN